MKTLGYYNGRFAEIEEMTIPMTDRACWFGDGVYDAGLSVDYHMVFLDEHIDRFFRSAGLSLFFCILSGCSFLSCLFC